MTSIIPGPFSFSVELRTTIEREAFERLTGVTPFKPEPMRAAVTIELPQLSPSKARPIALWGGRWRHLQFGSPEDRTQELRLGGTITLTIPDAELRS